MWKGFWLSQLLLCSTKTTCSKLDMIYVLVFFPLTWILNCSSLPSPNRCSDFYFLSLSTLMLYIPFGWDVKCLQRQWQKKVYKTWILKNMKWSQKRISASFQLSISQTPSGDFICSFEFETWNPMYPMMLKCNVCIAQCLLVVYYKSSDQSIKWISSPPLWR